MVLVPEIVDAVGLDAHVLAAGGIGSGRQIAAALALGAGGVWMGSYWLTTAEYDLGSNDAMQRALVAAGSDQTVRTRVYSGKPARLLKTKWTEAWAEDGAADRSVGRPVGCGDAGGADRREDERGAAGR
jgi:NAD(P)H-dependent flavin oxidoreductase YrpB (nitropropane dioxygenase family)